jgi:site-specific DNA-methyltransferase (cytosine-N4-specific)
MGSPNTRIGINGDGTMNGPRTVYRLRVHRRRFRESLPMGAHFVREGDAYDLMKTLPPNSVDLVITSPPYWGHRTYDQRYNWNILKELKLDAGEVPSYEAYRQKGGVLGLEPLPDWYVQHLVEILDLANICLKPHGSLWVNIGDTYFARWSSIRLNGRQGLGNNPRERRRTPMGGYRQEKQLLLIPARFAIAMQERRWILRNDLIWHKPNVPPRPETDRLRLAHEHFFHFVRRPKEGRAKYYYDLRHVEPGANDVVTCYARAGEANHSATFPASLIRPRILSSCPPGGLVLDPFCGTGRALVVALDAGRQSLGFEISPSYAKRAREAVLARHALNGAAAE